VDLPRWGIVTTVDAPADLILCHAAYHIAAGASEVHIFLDEARRAPDPDLIARLTALPGCRVTVAGRAYWRANRRRRPRLHQVRQTLNATAALEASAVDYLLHLDIDEYLWQWEPLAEELRLVPPGAYLKIGNIERIFTALDRGEAVFTPTFRLPDTLFDDAAVDEGGLTQNGLTGHSAGKAVTPKGFGYTVGIHRPRHPGPRGQSYPRHRLSEAATLLHFDGFTRRDWVFKLLRKGEALAADAKSPASEARLRQVAALMAEGNDLAAAERLHDRLKCLSADEEAALRVAGRVVDIPFDPSEALARYLPDLSLDLSVAGYDRWLFDAKRETFARFGLSD
jgi:hypothetical protein